METVEEKIKREKFTSELEELVKGELMVQGIISTKKTLGEFMEYVVNDLFEENENQKYKILILKQNEV